MLARVIATVVLRLQFALRIASSSTLWALVLPGCGATDVTAAKPESGPPATAPHGHVYVPRAPERAKTESTAAAPLGQPEQQTGEIRRHPDAGTKMEMVSGRYHLHVAGNALWLEASATVTEAHFDAAAGKLVRLTLRKRQDAADTSNPHGEQRPVDGLPARTVYVVTELVVVR